MGTTITLDDRLLAKLKRRASGSGTSVSRIVEQAIRLLIEAPRTPRRKDRFELVTFGAGGRFCRRNIDRVSSLIEADDVERLRKHGRARRRVALPVCTAGGGTLPGVAIDDSMALLDVLENRR